METATTFSIASALASVAQNMQAEISAVVPIALTVAGTVLVITMGWRLFRNFSKG